MTVTREMLPSGEPTNAHRWSPKSEVCATRAGVTSVLPFEPPFQGVTFSTSEVLFFCLLLRRILVLAADIRIVFAVRDIAWCCRCGIFVALGHAALSSKAVPHLASSMMTSSGLSK